MKKKAPIVFVILSNKLGRRMNIFFKMSMKDNDKDDYSI